MNPCDHVDDEQNIAVTIEIDKSHSPKENDNFYIVGIGASAGGLEALEQFFSNMPNVSNIAFVVIQHLSPDFVSLMPELLSRNTDMKVFQIQDGMKIMPGCIYLNPPKYTVTISHGQLFTEELKPLHKINLSINVFLESLAADMIEKSIAIILSGTGSDGTRGCRAIKEAGGIVIAQNIESAKFDGMPKSIISTNISDFVAAPANIPEILLKYTNQASLITTIADVEQKVDESSDFLSQIYNLIKKRYTIDFSLYKQSTVLRCLDRRIRICQIQTLEEYVSYLIDNIKEIESLYNSLLIGVTRFFRDTDAFDVIKNKVIPEIIDRKADNSAVRVWVTGCSTGEEAYSLAILFKEYLDTIKRSISVKIFATDVDSNAIEYASKGIYPDSISNEVSLDLLNRYFIKKRDGYHISKYIRDMVIFSCHNVINNPPFHKIDLLTCRNLLIYFQPNLQRRIISTFQFALETDGFMFLGSSESTGEMSNFFSTFDAKWKIFKRKDMKKRPLVDDFSVITTGIMVNQSTPAEDYYSQIHRSNIEMEEIYVNLIEECLPPSVLVDENGELVHTCGDVDKYLKVPRGKVYYDIQRMVPKDLSTALGTAISKVKKEKRSVTYTNIKVNLKEEQIIINLIVKPLFTKKSGFLVLVIFEEVKNSINSVDQVENFDTISELQARISDLEQELQYTKESLQISIEEIETSSEELQSANEELLVSNEELHSTNEELQSVNQELMVVNTQYQYKIQELADLNNDMTNFLNSTTIGTIFLDSNLCVRKFTPAVTKEVNLIEQDLGRPISHISHNLINEDLVKESRNVMDNLIPIEKEIQSTNNRWYILKYSPYRTNENVIKGIVLSLVDITLRKQAEVEIVNSRERYEKLVELSPFAILIIKEGNILFSNTAGFNLFQVKSSDDLIGFQINRYLPLDELLLRDKHTEYAQSNENKFIPIEEKITRKDGSEIHVEVFSMPFSMDEENSQLIILRDITFIKLENELRLESERHKQLLEEVIALDTLRSNFFSNLSHELRTPLNVIMSTLQLLKAQSGSNTLAVSEKQEKYYKIMTQNCYRQLRLVNNMIDITKIDSGFFDINLKNHNIICVIENITLSVSEYIKSKGIELVFDTDMEERIIAFDLDSFERIMLNLLSNAVKFTQEGGTINVDIINTTDSVIISVKDTGIGIQKDKQKFIFDRFRQVDQSLTRNNEGSGIGLSLVKSLVEMNGGKISVESEYGYGTKFIIEMPTKKLQEENAIVYEENLQQGNVEKIHIEFADIYNL
ncbi:MAG: methyltransferase/methylesterase, CheR/CheB with sensor [Herbinix sp.]|jgi:two-component system CheB/CheR fusion protein|nr:methyltransferase/methylesterase, CheR/CheB with sensor [Herbinix sp.]